MTLRNTTWTILLLAIAGCGAATEPADPPDAPAVLTESEFTAAQQAQKEEAVAAQQAMFDALLGELTEVLAASGPGAAISVCRDEAPRIAARVAEEHGVAIGRTSFRLRNPDNQPPEWAAPLVAKRVEQPAYVALDQGRLGALLPIRLKSNCLICHGTDEQIVPEVRDALARNYPQDQATGFQEGDLRGWFWVEVPPASES